MKKAHHLTPSSSHSNGERQSEGCHCRSAGNQIHSVKKKHTSQTLWLQNTGPWMQVKLIYVAKTFVTNLIKGLVRADDHL